MDFNNILGDVSNFIHPSTPPLDAIKADIDNLKAIVLKQTQFRADYLALVADVEVIGDMVLKLKADIRELQNTVNSIQSTNE